MDGMIQNGNTSSLKKSRYQIKKKKYAGSANMNFSNKDPGIPYVIFIFCNTAKIWHTVRYGKFLVLLASQ